MKRENVWLPLVLLSASAAFAGEPPDIVQVGVTLSRDVPKPVLMPQAVTAGDFGISMPTATRPMIQAAFADGDGATWVVCEEPGPPELSSLSLENAIRIALEHNEDIKQAYGHVGAARAGLKASKGVYDLNVFSSNQYGQWNRLSERDYAIPANAATGYFRSDSGLRQRVPTGGTVSAYYTTSNEHLLGTDGNRRVYKDYFTFEFVQSLLRGIGDPENRAAIRKAALEIEDSEAARSVLVSRVTLDVVRAYHILKLARQSKDVTDRILGLAKEVSRLEGIRQEKGIGLAQGVDVDRAQMTVRQREYNVRQAERDIAIAQERLMLLLNTPGYAPEWRVEPSDSLDGGVAPMPDPEAAKYAALTNRQELQQMHIMLERLGIERRVAANNRLPNLDLSAGYTTSQGGNTLRGADYFKDTGRQGSWQVGLTLAFPVQNRAAQGEMERNAELLRVANERLNMARRSVLSEVQETFSNLELARVGIPVAREAMELAEEVVKKEEARRETDSRLGNRDLLASHDSLGNLEIVYQTAVAQYHIALAEHRFACATLLDHYRIRIGTCGVDMDPPAIMEP